MNAAAPVTSQKQTSLAKYIQCIIALFFLAGAFSCGKDVVIMTYNVENLFDDKLDGSEYPEYRPRPGRWTEELFLSRLTNLAEVIRKSSPGGADIIALQEIENKNVLHRLSSLFSGIDGYQYRIIVPASGSPTNTAILSRYEVRRIGAYSIPPFEKNPLRNILEAEIAIGSETLFLFCNHWKSRVGSVEATEAARIEASGMLKRRISAVLAGNPGAHIIVAGDLNESENEYSNVKRAYQTALLGASERIPEDFKAKSIFITGSPKESTDPGKEPLFFEPWLENASGLKGSYVFGKAWERIDHILLSEAFFDGRGLEYREKSFMTPNLPFLVNTKNGYPLRWDPKTRKGYSDHLPLIVKIEIK